MSISKIITIFCAIFFIFGAAVIHSDEIVRTVPQIIKEAKSQISEVTVVELKNDFDAGKEFVLLDVRTAEEFNAGHSPKSVNSYLFP